jgi:hypothetical protein
MERAEAEAILDGDREVAVALLMRAGELGTAALCSTIAHSQSQRGTTMTPLPIRLS